MKHESSVLYSDISTQTTQIPAFRVVLTLSRGANLRVSRRAVGRSEVHLHCHHRTGRSGHLGDLQSNDRDVLRRWSFSVGEISGHPVLTWRITFYPGKPSRIITTFCGLEDLEWIGQAT